MSKSDPGDWTDPNFKLPEDCLDCFMGEPKRVFLNPGIKIYRFRSSLEFGRIVKKGHFILQSPWWFPGQTRSEILNRSEATDASITSCARSGLAVPEGWNPYFDNLVVFSLKQAGWAFEGEAKYQPVDEARSVLLPGGMIQLYIPNLQPDQVTLENYGSVRGF